MARNEMIMASIISMYQSNAIINGWLKSAENLRRIMSKELAKWRSSKPGGNGGRSGYK
jgi:hypothetical protein